ncbi:MAG TPA: biotin--[acetyl-CoA-carboxylase] ligase [bacterium]|nr:biotin--[acetyl-CoA-carboxylase] ligase [bacterium]
MKPPADLCPTAIAAALRTRWLGREQLFIVEHTGSTNADLLVQAAQGAPAGTVLVADHQYAGRGRKVRRWISQPGRDLLCSVLLRPPRSVEQWPSLVLAAGVAAYETLTEFTAGPLRLKWPNDVLLNAKKVCGILSQTQLGDFPALVVGLGVNVNSLPEDFPDELSGAITSLAAESGGTVGRGELLARLLFHLEKWYELWLHDRPRVFHRWEEAAHLQDQSVTVTEETQTYQAMAEGLNADGSLRVRIGSEVRHVACGDVLLTED